VGLSRTGVGGQFNQRSSMGSREGVRSPSSLLIRGGSIQPLLRQVRVVFAPFMVVFPDWMGALWRGSGKRLAVQLPPICMGIFTVPI